MKWKRVYIEITNQCNLHCSFCIGNVRTPKKMSVTEFEHVLIEISPYCQYVYLHILGEPLSHPELEEILALCKKYEMKVHITTNGTLLAKCVAILKKYPPRQINVSLHSFPHQKDTFHYVKEVLNACDELKQHSYISYRFWNLHERQLSDDSKMVLHLLEVHYGLQVEADAWKNKRVTLTDQVYLNFDDVFEWPSLKHDFVSEKGTCLGAETMIGILSDGSVVPCCLDSRGDVNFGNIFSESLAEILQSKRWKLFMEAKQKRHLNEMLCQRCKYRTRFEKGSVGK